MNISQLSSLAKLVTANPNEAKAVIKLATIDVLKSLGDGKYSILVENKTVTAQSNKPLSEGSKYWTQMSQNNSQTPKLSNLLKMPQMLKNFQLSNIEYSLKDLQTLLNAKKPEIVLKTALLENLTNANTKDEFTNTSNLLLSLQNNTFTIPLHFHNYFSILQFKKRYNKRSKKSHIDFYAALENLGPVSGIISLDEANIEIELNVAFIKTKIFLQQNMENISYPINITVIESIEPLYSADINSLLDISI